MTMSAGPTGLTVQCGDRLLDSDNLEWAKLAWGNPERAAAQVWGSGRASQRRSYGSEQNSPELPTVELRLMGK